jgi:protein SCO1/2
VAVTCVVVLLGAAGATAVKRFTGESTAAAAPHISGHFALTTPDGRTATDQSYRGKWLLVYFGYTFCPDACPTALNAIATALDELGPLADKVQPVFITVDPGRDTPKVIADFVKLFDPRIVGLRGTPEQTAAAAKEYHVYYAVRKLKGDSYVIDHSAFIYVINPEGAFVQLLTGDVPGHRMADELQRLVK